MSQDKPQPDSGDRAKMIFLLTKPPQSVRAGLCRRLMEQSRDAVLYLAGDGVYNLAGEALSALPRERIIACREDLEARGIRSDGRAALPVDFYGALMDDIMNQNSRIYTF
jgi:tRNA 2-thiouridine synthesizing protein B